MSNACRGLVGCFVLVLFMLFWCGCVSLHGHDEFHFTVVDAESHLPLEGVKISSSYDWTEVPIINRPEPSEVFTDNNGKANIRVALFPFYWTLSVESEGYLRAYLRGNDSDTVHSDNVKVDKCNVDVLFYKGPEPKVEIVVPDGYRGPVALDLEAVDKTIQEEAGKRIFSYLINSNGYVHVEASMLLQALTNDNITARYGSGGLLHRADKKDSGSVGFRWVIGRQEKRLFIAGTEEDRNDLMRNLHHDPVEGKRGGILREEVFNSYFDND